MSRRPVAVLVALVLAGCDPHPVPTAPRTPAGEATGARALSAVSGPPSALAVAATPAFLPPLGAGAADPATFDATAADAVEICAWSGSACTAPPVARFATTASGSTLPLVVNTTAGRYEASWDLLDARFLSRQTYRIRVLAGAAELGAVSVDVVRGRWALTRADGTLAPLTSAATLPIRFVLTAPPTNRPPVAAIASPTPNATFAVGEAIAFSGGATDPEDGALTGAALVWRSNRDGQIGTGASFSAATLSVGAHVVTLTATDGQGASGTATVNVAVTPATGPGPLTNGATATGRIGAAQQVDVWTFTAKAGDHAVLSLGETGTTNGFSPWLRVVDASGSVIGSNFGFVAAQVELNGLAAGTYTVRVASGDGGGVGTGDYRLTLIEAPGALVTSPGDQGGTLVNGATSGGSIYEGDVDGWTFTAAAGDRAVVSLGETGTTNGFAPWLRVVGPDGVVVATNFGFTAAQVEFRATLAGTYTVIVGSAGGGFTGSGDYLLTLVKGPGALTISAGDQGGALVSGATQVGSIYEGDVDGWTFTANAGDHAIVSLGETGATAGFSPWLRVIGPDGAVVGSNFGSVAAQVELDALAAGTYTVVVGSAAGGFTGSGDYRLTVIAAPGALAVSAGDEGGPLTNGATSAGSLYDGDVDGWTFTANAGERAIVSLGETGVTAGLSPWLRVIGPDGTVVASNFGFSAAQVEFGATVAGTYTVVVGSAAGGFTGSGDYLLTLVRAPGALTVSTGDQGGALTNGATHEGSIGYDGDVDAWTFTANAGDHAIVSLGETGATVGLSPWLRVVGPTGTVVASNFGFVAAQVELNALAAGTYTVVVGSAGGGFTGTGDYRLTLVRAPGALTVSAGDQGGTLAAGVTRTGSIYDGDVDGWTFTAAAGAQVTLDLAETGTTNGFSPWLRVIGPTGIVVASNFGFAAAQVQLTGLAAGTYTVVVGSAGGGFTGSGDYTLLLSGTGIAAQVAGARGTGAGVCP